LIRAVDNNMQADPADVDRATISPTHRIVHPRAWLLSRAQPCAVTTRRIGGPACTLGPAGHDVSRHASVTSKTSN
jgi:hypothetical protein